MADTPLLELRRLTMQFGGLTAVSEVDLAVPEGAIFSLIGPNGAGKTTVFNAITGLYTPSDGEIRYQGRRLERPLNFKVAAVCLGVGLFTALVAVLASLNVDKLWRASIKVPMANGRAAFTYATAWQRAKSYAAGELSVERQRRGRYGVYTADGTQLLGSAPVEVEARDLATRYEELLLLAPTPDMLVERAGQFELSAGDPPRVLLSATRRETAENTLRQLASVAAARRTDRTTVWIALVAGIGLGSAGAFTVWHRARCTPDVVALAGIARTFQNIRLFQNMTVLHNVLVGMDRWFKGGLIRMLLRTPGLRRAEAAARREALELLKFVGLEERAGSLAKNLPYGDQRRLEIARALAARPRLLLLDEPAAGMNPTETAELMQLIRAIRERRITLVLIEHHMNLVMGISDRIAVLEYGRKIAEGTPGEVRENPQVIEAYLGKDAEA